jgi:hypothetical protein
MLYLACDLCFTVAGSTGDNTSNPKIPNLQGLAPSARQGGTASGGSSFAWAPFTVKAAPKPVAAKGSGLGRPQTAAAQRSAKGKAGNDRARKGAEPSRRDVGPLSKVEQEIRSSLCQAGTA